MIKLVRVRRCHCCGEVLISESDILKCTQCHTAFLPFFYFEKREAKDITEDELKGSSDIGPITGLTAYW